MSSRLGLLVSVVQLSPTASTVHAAGTGFVPLATPKRVLDTRPGNPTADGAFAGTGLRPSSSTLALPIAGRVGVPSDATAVVLNVTVTEATGSGFVTVYPCGAALPTASSLNYTAGQTVANMVIAKIGAAGQVCLFNTNPTQLIVDVTGYFPGVDAFTALSAPARLLDTRPGMPTIDGQNAGSGIRPDGQRAGPPGDRSGRHPQRRRQRDAQRDRRRPAAIRLHHRLSMRHGHSNSIEPQLRRRANGSQRGDQQAQRSRHCVPVRVGCDSSDRRRHRLLRHCQRPGSARSTRTTARNAQRAQPPSTVCSKAPECDPIKARSN